MSADSGARGAGGTPGGIGMFVGGAVMLVAGVYLLLNRVMVSSGGGWYFHGYNPFGLSLVPLLVGIGFLFYNGRSVAGWVLAGIGVVIIFAGIIANLDIYFRPSSLFDTLMILVLIAGGIGFIARSLRASPTT